MIDEARAELAPSGTLRAGINIANPLLVTGATSDGAPDGVAPSLAAAIAARLGVPIALVPYASPALLSEAVGTGEWDIALLGAEPQRARKILFTAPYVEISATYLVPPGARFMTVADVDAPGVSIAVNGGSAYDLWLSANIQHATLERSEGFAASLKAFAGGGPDVLAGLRSALVDAAPTVPGSRILDGQFTAIQQAVGVSRAVGSTGAAFLSDFVEDAKSSGLVKQLIERFGVADRLSVSPTAAA